MSIELQQKVAKLEGEVVALSAVVHSFASDLREVKEILEMTDGYRPLNRPSSLRKLGIGHDPKTERADDGREPPTHKG